MIRLKKILFTALLLRAISAPAEDFILSYWCGPPEGKDLDKRYAEVAECGFNYAMLPCSGASIAGNQAVLDACKKHKLKYIILDPRILSFSPGQPQFNTNLDAIIAAYSKHKATGGYFIADEPSPGAFPQLGGVNQYLLTHDPKHLPFINLYPNYCPEWALGGNYEQYVQKFLDTVKPRLLSFDHYALMTDGSTRPNYFDNLEVIRRQALLHDVPFASIFLVTPLGGYRDPSEADLRWQANTALVYGAHGLLYFTYWPPTGDPAFKNSDAIIDRQGRRSPHYEQVKRINAGLNAWAPTIMKLKSTGVYHTGKLPATTQPLPAEAPAQVEGTGEWIIGTFKHQDGSDWLMLMNRDLRHPASATLRRDDKIKRVRELTPTKGRLTTLKLRDHKLTIEIPAGDARLFKLSR